MPLTCIFFYHLPKSGGVSFVQWLASNFNLTANTFYRQQRAPFRLHSSARTVSSGHYHPVVNECHSITLLRDPIHRVISALFYHNHRGKSAQIYMLSNAAKNCSMRYPNMCCPEEYFNDIHVTRFFSVDLRTHWNH